MFRAALDRIARFVPVAVLVGFALGAAGCELLDPANWKTTHYSGHQRPTVQPVYHPPQPTIHAAPERDVAPVAPRLEAEDLGNWSSTGIQDGRTSMGRVFSYNVKLPSGGVTRRTATFATKPSVSGRVTFDWEYTGMHCWYQAEAQLQVISGGEVIDLVNKEKTSGEFSFRGTATVNVVVSQPCLIIIGGKNYDNTSRLDGALKITNVRGVSNSARFCALGHWVNGNIDGGTTSTAPITELTGAPTPPFFSYDVKLPSGGVSRRTATFSTVAPAAGRVTFDWEYTGMHCWYQAETQLQVICGGTTIDLVNKKTNGDFTFTGTTTVDLQAGQKFGFVVGGKNYDNTSRLLGTLKITNVRVD